MNVPAVVLLENFHVSLAVAYLCAMFVFVHYLWNNRESGYKALRPAIALTFVWAGGLLSRAALWRVDAIAEYSLLWLATSWMILLGAILCCIRVFSPTSWGNKSWVISLSLVLIVTIAVSIHNY